LHNPDQGSIRIDGETLFDARKKISLSPEKRRIGVVFQQAHLFPHMGVEQNLLYGYRRMSKRQRKIDPRTLIEVLGLDPLLGRNVTSLSGGERQRVALGRTVLSCPRLILMDEPLNGLDEGLKYQIIPYLKRVFAEFDIPLLFISHSLNEMRLMTDQVLEFRAGRLIGHTTAEDLARRRMGSSQVGYINLIPLKTSRKVGDLQAYQWGEQELVLSVPGDGAAGMFELSSKDITLFKRHPEASSARNVLRCRVTRLFGADNRVGVEMDCGGQPLVSQVVGEALADLELAPGRELVAVIKASAFRRLY
jgi:molybdate transport system ATP-binding protein